MRVTDLLKEQGIQLGSKVNSKKQAIEKLIALQVASGNIADEQRYKDAILAREAQGSTAVGYGIAIPHAKSDAVKCAGLAAITVPTGVNYEAVDGKPSDILFMIAAPPNGDLHLEVLSRLMVLLMDEGFRKQLINAQSKKEFLKIIDKKETEKYGEEAKTQADSNATYRVLGVTACPTGIAHTYMAAEALEKAGKEMGVSIKVETDGSGGAKNVLTKKEIADADGIIVAADREVEMARFNGKRVIKVKVSDGISKPQELIKKAVSGTAPVYTHAGGEISVDDGEKESVGRQIYKHLMNGVSHMLPFVIGGGIMIAIAFLIDTIAGAPQDSSFGTYTQAAAFFKAIGGAAFGFMMPVLAGFIAMSIADRPGLAVGFVGGSIATLGCTFMAPTGDAAAVSGFIGALIAGFAGGFIVLFLRRVFAFLPKSMEGIKPVLIYPLLGILIMGVFMCAINPFVGWVNTALSNGLNSLGTEYKVVLGCVLGGMMAIDMGGPFNKAAYVFGTAALATGGYDIMAAVMIGGMVPPIAIALCATFFKKKFSSDERQSAMVNYIMGLCFITEGAIPFAAADPLRVIPSCIAGSAVAGGISMAFNCGLMAPHGGVFVFPVVTNVLWYVVALLVGSIISMLLLAMLKKNKATEALPIQNK
ncbi:MAG TPA: PTS transporter subunit EIIA [Clostridiales bacterium]|nr:PTS transporter subunit EIIA [Clostridiales bacterium]